MFDFLFHTKRSEVRRFLSNRVNRSVLEQMRVGNRDMFRNAYCEIVWVIPCDDTGKELQFDAAYPVVTRDICPAGLSMIQQEPFTAKRAVIAIEGDAGRTFIRCSNEHCTSLGYGFYQVGLYPEEIVQVDPRDADAAEQAVEHTYSGEAVTV